MMSKKGEILFSQGRAKEAESEFLKILETDPFNAEALNNLGVISHSRGDTRTAMDFFHKAISLQGDHTDATLNLAALYQESGRWDLAGEVVKSGLKASAGRASLWNALSTIYLHLGKSIEARNALSKSLEIDPHQEEARRQLEDLGGFLVSDTIWHYKKFSHQKFPESININIFKRGIAGVTPITKETRITSMGSCFARNLAEYLISRQYNYLITETPFKQASAHWDQVFNTSSMRQIFEYTFTDEWHPLIRWWPHKNQVQDPFRRDIIYPRETCETDFERHRAASRRALTEAEWIIITLGLVEIWRDRRDKMAFYRVPAPSLYDPAIHEFHIQTVDDCLGDLNRIQELLNRCNPKASIIITVSPVPLFATFRSDVDVVSANTLSKSTLRVAAELFALQHENVHYFSSYEIVTQAIPSPYEKDNRHVTNEAVAKIMEVFEDRFVQGGRS